VSEQENTKVVEQVHESFKSGDIQSLVNLLSNDVEWELPSIANVPFSGKLRGREQVGKFFRSLAVAKKYNILRRRSISCRGIRWSP
jgi:ketosteroid isomerase-like protein